MPEINLTKILSVSSEEKNFSSESLLQSGQFKKWKCKQGEAKAIVIIQLEKSSYIHKIDIGNEGSAFIEILVGRSSLSEQDFHVILVASSFMSPSESKSSQNLNRVRMFGDEDLNKSVTSQKWDVVKIVCTQPFNKNLSYGISFAKFYSPSDEAYNKIQSNIGNFQMKINVDEKIEIGGLFKKRNLPPTLTKNLIVSDIKASSKESLASSSSKNKDNLSHDEYQNKNCSGSLISQSVSANSNKKQFKDKPRDETLNSIAIDDITVKTLSKNKDENDAKNNNTKYNISKSQNENISTSSQKNSTPPIKKPKLSNNEVYLTKSSNLNEIMMGVVFTISGIANPMRGQLRDKAVEMGAKYKPDWDATCTHLICAFENTPKFSQVNGKGIIVKKEWVEACYKQKKLLPWKDFRLGRAKSPPIAETKAPAPSTISSQPSIGNKLKANISNINNTATTSKKDPNNVSDTILHESDEIYSKDTDSESDDLLMKNSDADNEKNKVMQTLVYDDDEMINKITDINYNRNVRSDGSEEETHSFNDTDEELQEFIANEQKLQKENKVIEREDCNEESVLKKLPDFFYGKTFLLYGSFSIDERKLLRRYIIAYNGKLCEYMDESVQFVVTNSNWDHSFDQALNENANLIFVRPTWLSECSELQKLTPFQKHIVPAV